MMSMWCTFKTLQARRPHQRVTLGDIFWLSELPTEIGRLRVDWHVLGRLTFQWTSTPNGKALKEAFFERRGAETAPYLVLNAPSACFGDILLWALYELSPFHWFKLACACICVVLP